MKTFPRVVVVGVNTGREGELRAQKECRLVLQRLPWGVLGDTPWPRPKMSERYNILQFSTCTTLVEMLIT